MFYVFEYFAVEADKLSQKTFNGYEELERVTTKMGLGSVDPYVIEVQTNIAWAQNELNRMQRPHS